jgi:hypothetical protein
MSASGYISRATTAKPSSAVETIQAVGLAPVHLRYNIYQSDYCEGLRT